MFRGSFTALVTPFKNAQFDRATFEKQIEFQAKHGTHGIVPVGTTGESPTLSHEEHHHVFDVAVQAAKGAGGGGMKVIAGTGSNATDEAIDLTRFAKKIGADAALIVVPYYNKPSQEGMYRHFKAIATAVDIPIVLYNIPGRTGVTMSTATTIRLAKEFKNIVGMKEATGSLDSCSELCALAPDGFTVLSGDDSLTLPFMSVGAAGVISVATNIIPRQMRDLVDAALANDFATARHIHQRHFDLFKALFVEGNPMGIKTAMALLGRDTGEMRLPLCEVSAGARHTIKTALFNLGLIQDNLA